MIPNRPDTITEIQKTNHAQDGSQTRLTVYLVSTTGKDPLIGIYGHRRDNESQPWILCDDRPHPDWKSMSVEKYEKHGRSELLRHISRADIFKCSALLGQTLEQAQREVPGARITMQSGYQHELPIRPEDNEHTDENEQDALITSPMPR